MAVLLLTACSGGGGGGGNNADSNLTDAGSVTYVKSYSTPGSHLTHLASAPAPNNGHTVAALKSHSIVIMSLDNAGDVRWAQDLAFSIPSSFPLVSIAQMTEATDGNIWVSGRGRGDTDGRVLAKLSSTGDVLLTIPLPQRVYVSDLAATPDGSIIAAGSIVGRRWVRRIGADGTTLLEINYNDRSSRSEYVDSVTLNADGSLILTGHRFVGNYDLDFWVARHDAQGNEIFDETYGMADYANDAIFLPQAGSNVNRAGIIAVGYQDYRSSDQLPVFAYLNHSTGDEVQSAELSDLGSGSGEDASIVPAADVNEFWVGSSRLTRLCSEDTDPACYRWDNALQRYRRDANDDEFTLASAHYFEALPNDDRYRKPFRGMARDSAGNPIVAFLNANGILAIQKRSAANPSTVLWQNQLPRYFGDYEHPLEITQDGGVLFAHGNYLMRLNADGTTRWAQSYYERAPSRVLLTPSSGGRVLTLVSNEHGTLYRAFDESGTILFSRFISGVQGIGIIPVDANNDGTPGDELILVTDEDDGTNLVRINGVTGEGISRISFSAHLPVETVQTGQGFLIRTDQGILRFTSRGELDSFWRINGFPVHSVRTSVTADGGMYLVNRTVQRPIQVLALGSSGQIRWHRSYIVNQLVANQFEGFLNASATPDGGLIVNQTITDTSPGASCSDPGRCGDGIAFKIDSNGNVQWNKVYGAAQMDSFESALGRSDNGGILFGRSNSFTYPTDTLFAARLDANGNVSESCVANASYTAEVIVSNVNSQTLSISSPFTSSPDALPLPAIQEDIPYAESVEIVTARSCAGTSQAPVLTVSISGPGRVNSTPNGIACSGGTSDCAQAFTSGTTVTLQALPNANSRFREWGGNCAQFGDAATVTIPLSASMNCRAEFGSSNSTTPIYTPPTYTPPTGSCSSVTPGDGSDGAACRTAGDCATPGYCTTACACTVPQSEAPCQNEVPGTGANDEPCRDNWDCDNPSAPGTEGLCNLLDCRCNVS